ncbi:MAG: penicillin-binding transpeptidase domain-containing protein [Oscillospiraceae bacterium]|nr:penicillin-binding transpeptidase domain-containing protein [Oscillospiraceae bacterium]
MGNKNNSANSAPGGRSIKNAAPSRAMKVKLYAVFALILLFMSLITYNLFNTAIVNAEYYRSKANAQQLRSFTIPANRGTIYDANGKILAQSKTVWTIVIAPKTIQDNHEVFQTQRHSAAMREYYQNLEDGVPAILPVSDTVYDEASEICRMLADIFELDYDDLMKLCRESEYNFEIIKKQVEKPQVDALNEFKLKYGIGVYSVYAVEDTKRLYPNGSLAANVIGFTNYDNMGIYGVEAYYDEYLQGTNGLFVMAMDANNRIMPFDYEMRHEAQNGNSLYLTIDEVLQHYLEKNLEIAHSQHLPDNRATGIVMNANTGAILAMATYPSFDLNDPSVLSDFDYEKLEQERIRKVNDTLIINGFHTGTEADLTPEQVEKIDRDMVEMHSVLRETQWKNKAISELYFPGSVFKVITMANALEEHLISESTGFFCGGVSTIADTNFHCWNIAGHGSVDNLTIAITKSCNPAFIEIGRRLGTNKFCDYFEAFGFTNKTGIDLPGEANSLYLKRESMGPVELASSSFGQTNKITPLQMITAYAASVNGGHLVTPYVVDKIIDKDGNIIKSNQPNIRRQVISEDTSALVRQILEDVVTVNGGNNAYIAGYRIGGKSGTSEKIDDFPEGNHFVGSFGAFTPANDPEIIMLVMVDDPRGGLYYGSAVAAPVVSAVFKETLPYLEIYPTQLSEEELAQQDTIVPVLTGLSRHQVVTELNERGLNHRFVGEDEGTRVIYTVPPANSPIPRGGEVVVYMSEQEAVTAIVPNVTGLSAAEANRLITNAGLNIKLTGGAINNNMAQSISQSVEAGRVVPLGTVVEVEFMVIDGHAG